MNEERIRLRKLYGRGGDPTAVRALVQLLEETFESLPGPEFGQCAIGWAYHPSAWPWFTVRLGEVYATVEVASPGDRRQPKQGWRAQFKEAIASQAPAMIEPAQQSPSEETVSCPIPFASQPRGEDLFALYPQQPEELGVSGHTRIACTVLDSGAASCSVVREIPEGWGFGEASLRAAERFRIDPVDCSGVSTAGRSFQRTINWGDTTELCRTGLYFQPGGQEFMEAYPERALRDGVSGRITMRCIVGENGAVACEVLDEQPSGYGFGAAGLALAAAFRAAPVDCSGESTVGRTFERTFRWRAE